MTSKGIRPVKWRKFEKFLIDNGCVFVRQKGSHRVYNKPELLRPIIFAAHTTDLPVSIIMNNLRTLNCSHEQYLEYLNHPKKKS